MNSKTFEYDAFISYSSDDKKWADKLVADLKVANMNPFLDHENLEPGQLWQRQLSTSLFASKHLIVLWTQNARNSNWVLNEIRAFNRLAKEDKTRRLLTLVLEDIPIRYPEIQAITDLIDGSVYNKGIEDLDEKLWHGVITKVVKAIKEEGRLLPIPLVVLAATEAQIRELIPTQKVPLLGNSLEELLHDLGIGTMDDLLHHYGATRGQWRPFGGKHDIDTVLSELLTEINDNEKVKTQGISFRWELIGERFWSENLVDIDREAKTFCSRSPVIVVDPISLFVDEISERLNRLQRKGCFECEGSAIMILTPFDLPETFRNLRQFIDVKANIIHEQYYHPPIHHEQTFATCGINIADATDARRVLCFAFKARLPKPSKPDNAYTEWGL